MSTKRAHTTQVTELEQFGQTFRRGKRLVTVRCSLIAGPDGRRFEVVLWSDGARAVVDVPAEAEVELPERISTATAMFLATLELRG